MPSPSIRLKDLAQQLDAELYGNGDIVITAIASMQSSKTGDITFMANPKYRKQLARCQASAVVLKKDDLSFSMGIPVLVVKNPYVAYARIAQLFNTKTKTKIEGNIANSAVIDSSVKLGNNVSIGANVVIEPHVEVSNNVIIGAGCFIGEKSKIGTSSHLYANVTIYHETEIGTNCLIHSGTVIGADGFGYANDNGKWIKIPHLGRVMIGNHVEIGSCTTIDRGSLDDTVIGNGVIIDNQCQIAHNVMIGENTAVAGGVIMAGSLKIGRYCMIGGASVINGHIEICDRVTVTGMGMVIRSITEPGIYSSGIPLQPNKIWRKTAALVMNISNLRERIKSIERNFYERN